MSVIIPFSVECTYPFLVLSLPLVSVSVQFYIIPFSLEDTYLGGKADLNRCPEVTVHGRVYIAFCWVSLSFLSDHKGWQAYMGWKWLPIFLPLLV